MAAAFALGAEGVQMGTRMVSATESPVHENFKRTICEAAETDTLLLNRRGNPALRAIRTPHTEELDQQETVALTELGNVKDLYFGGDMNCSIALSGQVIGRIESVETVERILHQTVEEFLAVTRDLARFSAADGEAHRQ
jgi:enoyl-[acyl-carrier protein] reductase II